jgi:hypothetical protein
VDVARASTRIRKRIPGLRKPVGKQKIRPPVAQAAQPIASPAPQTAEIFWPLVQIAAIWVASDIGYYFGLPVLGAEANYNSASLAITLYYVFWVGIAIITFWPLYITWPRYASWETFGGRPASYLVWFAAFGGCILFAAYVLPHLPPIHWKESWTPPDVVLASPMYFLPKSVEILFQQLLIVALVLALSAQQCSLRQISILSAMIFGGTHVLLAFGGVPVGYVIRFMLSAAAFGLLFPYLLLRVRNGFAYSYVIHWVYYAASVVMPHIFLSAVK